MTGLDPAILKRIRQIHIRSSKLVQEMLAGAYHSKFKGQGIEFEEVREYTPGDDIKSIDWNVTARMNFPYVKSFREERQLTVMLLVDISASHSFSSLEKTKGEWIAEIGAVLAFSAIQNNDRVGLILFTEEVELYIPPGKGQKHALRVIREILAFQPQKKGTSIKKALIFLNQVQKKHAVSFLISDFMDQGYETELKLTAKRHELIAMGIHDLFEKQLPPSGLICLQDLETQEFVWVDANNPYFQNKLKMNHEKRWTECRKNTEKAGASWIPLIAGEDYVLPIRRYFGERRKK